MTRLTTAMVASVSVSGASNTNSSCTCRSIFAESFAAFERCVHTRHGAANNVGGGALDRRVDRSASKNARSDAFDEAMRGKWHLRPKIVVTTPVSRTIFLVASI